MGLAKDMCVSALDSIVKGSLIFKNINFNVWIEFLEPTETSVSSRNLSNMFLFSVEVWSQIFHFCQRWIKKTNGLWSCKDEILRDLNTKPFQSNNDNLHFDEFAHCFYSERTNLPRIQVGVNHLSHFSGFLSILSASTSIYLMDWNLPHKLLEQKMSLTSHI